MRTSTHTTADVQIIGAGLAGSLLATLLARRGERVEVYERLPDMRRTRIPAGRSINLALAARGIRALELAGVMPDVMPLLIPMPGRLLHARDGELTFMPYGQREHEVIYSVSRPGLNRVLLDAAESAGATIHFRHALADVDFESRTLSFAQEEHGVAREVPMRIVIGADGAGSVLRRKAVAQLGIRCSEELLPHAYKELTLPARQDGRHRIEKNALHIWPRGGFMLIALPNLDGSFTVTLFLATKGEPSFESLNDAAAVRAFFAAQFADAGDLMPQLTEQFAAHPVGVMGTVRCEKYCPAGDVLLIGDAAHAMTPFHGQGMNAAFEDCRVLSEVLNEVSSWREAFERFEALRKPNGEAIADMALENYVEMRDTVQHPKFMLQKALSLELERRFPEQFVPRYSMVMFHDEIPYRLAYERGRIQEAILNELTENVESLADVDFGRAEHLIRSRLPPIPEVVADRS
ncbi:MAG: FAD-dependent monooxygenase [Xanthomonadaceae bacterium]|nr:FAD-dependent monooxygenase [Xanthomonadaceae bacterium]